MEKTGMPDKEGLFIVVSVDKPADNALQAGQNGLLQCWA
jgi:hypothetical protein